jgi:hypothetical protein
MCIIKNYLASEICNIVGILRRHICDGHVVFRHVTRLAYLAKQDNVMASQGCILRSFCEKMLY